MEHVSNVKKTTATGKRVVGTSSISLAGSMSFSQLPQGNHKEYLKQMLIAKFNKKYNQSGSAYTDNIICNEVGEFARLEKLSKDTVKFLERKIQDRLALKQN